MRQSQQSHTGLLPLSVRPERSRVYVAPEGEIDLANAHELTSEVNDLRAAGFDDIVVDLRRTEFIDSTTLCVLLELADAARAGSWRFALIPGPPPVQRVFELTQTLDRFELGPMPKL